MLNNTLIMIVLGCIVIAVIINALTLFRAEGKNKNWFLLTMLATLAFLVGYLLELLSPDTGAAFNAVRLIYVGSQLVGPFALFFVADFCEIKIHTWFVRVPLLAIALAGIVVMWTTDRTGWLYKEFWLNSEYSNSLKFVPAAGYSIIHIIPGALMAVCLVFIIYRMRTWSRDHVKKLTRIAVILLIPFIAESINYAIRITGLDIYNIYFTPHALLLMNILLFFFIVRYDFVEIKGSATERVIELVSEAYILLDDGRRFISANNAAKAMFPSILGFMPGEVIDEMEGWPKALAESVFEGEIQRIEYEMPDDNAHGRRYFVAEVCSVHVTLAGNRTAWSILIRDVTQSTIMLKELEEYAYRDPLTGLNNRRHFIELAQPAISKAERTGQPYFVFMLDLDHFKNVNDTYGHAAGDEVLRVCANVIKNALRGYDIVGRYGGEEFIVLISDAAGLDVMSLADRIRQNVEQASIVYGENHIRITISIGVAEREDKVNFETIIERADSALYIAKRTRNAVAMWDGAEAEPGALG